MHAISLARKVLSQLGQVTSVAAEGGKGGLGGEWTHGLGHTGIYFGGGNPIKKLAVKDNYGRHPYQGDITPYQGP